MSKINKAGARPAFPTKGPFEPGLKNSSFAYPGITIRDWFAGQIASGMAAFSGTAGVSYGPGDIAGRSYEIADAMLLARSILQTQDQDE